MFPKRFLVVALVALLALGLFTAINSTLQRDAWLQGYVIGRLSAGTQGGSAAPLPPSFNPGYPDGYPYGYGYGYRGSHSGGFFGFLFGIGLLFLLFAVLGRFFRYWAFQQRGGPRGGPWGGHGHRPPWWGSPWPGSEEAPESRPDQPGKGDRPEGGSFYA